MKSYQRAIELSQDLARIESWIRGESNEPLHITSKKLWDSVQQKAAKKYEVAIVAEALEDFRSLAAEAVTNAKKDLEHAQLIIEGIEL